MTKIYKPNVLRLLMISTIIIVLILILETARPAHSFIGAKITLIFVAIIIIAGLLSATAKIKILDQDILEYPFFTLPLIKRKTNIKDIRSIRKISFNFIISTMFVCNNQNDKFGYYIDDVVFDKKIIKEFIKDLMAINKNIQLDEYYQSLIKK